VLAAGSAARMACGARRRLRPRICTAPSTSNGCTKPHCHYATSLPVPQPVARNDWGVLLPEEGWGRLMGRVIRRPPVRPELWDASSAAGGGPFRWGGSCAAGKGPRSVRRGAVSRSIKWRQRLAGVTQLTATRSLMSHRRDAGATVLTPGSPLIERYWADTR